MNLSAFRASLISNYSVTAALVLVCYEFIVTFQYEYVLVWKRRWTGATWLFLGNRYFMLASILMQISPIQMCYNYPLQYFMNVVANLPTIIIAVFSALRVFALLERAYVPAAFTFALGLGAVALDMYQGSQITAYYVDDPVLGSSCYVNHLISPSVLFYKNYRDHILTVLTQSTATLASTLFTIVADIIAIAITWVKTYRLVREVASVGVNSDLGTMLLRHGSLYFIVLLIVNLMNGLIALIPSLLLVDPMVTFVEILPSIILSRFLINLRQVNTQESGSAAPLSRFSTLNFRMPSIPSVIGILGEPLAGNEDDINDEDYVVAEAYEDAIGVAVDSGEGVETPDGMNITSDEIEQVPNVPV
ncbi:hypothetical protein NM688_g7109 [Phlebia brevispora]|uniref:Uncharacterized protein n=1 Tax=Phlebia brevispora TaxID=194682 RepID=A0ACC1S932_9APHY|nr:hypothetical protein NM688_g7109 [Phlebia brevispora]